MLETGQLNFTSIVRTIANSSNGNRLKSFGWSFLHSQLKIIDLLFLSSSTAHQAEIIFGLKKYLARSTSLMRGEGVLLK